MIRPIHSRCALLICMTSVVLASKRVSAEPTAITLRGTPLFGEAAIEPRRYYQGFWTLAAVQIEVNRRWWAVESDLRVSTVFGLFQSLHGGVRIPVIGTAERRGVALALNMFGGVVGGRNVTEDDGYRQREAVFGPQGVFAVDTYFRGSSPRSFTFRLYGDYQYWAVNVPARTGWRVDPLGPHYEPTTHRVYVGMMFGVEFGRAGAE